MMNQGPKVPPKHMEFPLDSNRGDPMPRGAGDNNRAPFAPAQMKDKIFQQLQEVYNNPGRATHGVIYDPGVEGRNGPYNY